MSINTAKYTHHISVPHKAARPKMAFSKLSTQHDVYISARGGEKKSEEKLFILLPKTRARRRHFVNTSPIKTCFCN